RLDGIVKRFGRFTALSGVSLDVPHGALVTFLGPSGCGKTTLLRIIAGLETQDAGAVVQGGRDISRLPAIKRDYGIVFQSYALFAIADGNGRFRVGDVLVDAAPGAPKVAPGTSVKLYLRPEDVVVNGSATEHPNRAAGQVQKIEFLGAFCLVTVRVATAADQ